MAYAVTLRSGNDRITMHYPSWAAKMDGDLLRVAWPNGDLEIINVRDPSILRVVTREDAPEGLGYRDIVELGYYRNRTKGDQS